jgi:hypothetical protein
MPEGIGNCRGLRVGSGGKSPLEVHERAHLDDQAPGYVGRQASGASRCHDSKLSQRLVMAST